MAVPTLKFKRDYVFEKGHMMPEICQADIFLKPSQVLPLKWGGKNL